MVADALTEPVPGSPPDRDTLAAALEHANLPTLVPVLHQLTGDRRWLADPFRPTRSRGMDDNDDGGFPEDVRAEIRSAALEAVLAWSAGRAAGGGGGAAGGAGPPGRAPGAAGRRVGGVVGPRGRGAGARRVRRHDGR